MASPNNDNNNNNLQFSENNKSKIWVNKRTNKELSLGLGSTAFWLGPLSPTLILLVILLLVNSLFF